MRPNLGRRDAVLYLTAAGLGSFGLGVAQFYLNFLYRSLGFDAFEIGLLAGAEALGVVAGAIPAAMFTRGRSRRAAILLGGTLTGVGITGILVFNALVAVFLSAVLVGFGGIIASSSGAALLADATDASRRATRFGQQIALGTTAAFLSSAIAGALAAPVASVLGARPEDALVLRTLVASGGVIAALSIVPILAIRAVPVAQHTLEAPTRNDLVRRFLAIEVLFGFGAGSFLPFVNLFFADRYGVPFSALGLLLGVLAVAGSIGALLHGRFVASRLGAIPSIVLVETLSLPFALLAGFAGALPIAVGALAIRHFLMFGASGTVNAFQLSSFTPAERAGANAFFALAWSAANAVGAILSGAIRARLGPDGFTVNLVTLVIAYGLAALLTWVLFARHEPSGDVGARTLAVPDSRG
ncbi:MAG TPA: MFS transporter [Candidatus Bathyarchaeia archaeon]|nr:MFS transporter [Candidatus Bathyarchaeia archaeon]